MSTKKRNILTHREAQRDSGEHDVRLEGVRPVGLQPEVRQGHRAHRGPEDHVAPDGQPGVVLVAREVVRRDGHLCFRLAVNSLELCARRHVDGAAEGCDGCRLHAEKYAKKEVAARMVDTRGKEGKKPGTRESGECREVWW